MLRRIIDHITIRGRSVYDEIAFERMALPKIKAEKISKSLLKPLLGRAPVIVDCGAHDGSDSVLLAKVLRGTVHAFEPVPAIYQRLIRNTTRFDIKTYPIALSDVTGEATFNVSSGSSDASSSLLAPKDHLVDHPAVAFDEQIVVQTQTLDDWATSQGLHKVDLLWLDMQGAEMQMLKASTKILPTVRVIHSEVSVKETYQDACTYDQLRSFLNACGFTVLIEAIASGADMGNVVFHKK